MRITFNLTEEEIKKAIIDFIKKEKNVDVKTVHLTHTSGGDGPYYGGSSFSATASE